MNASEKKKKVTRRGQVSTTRLSALGDMGSLHQCLREARYQQFLYLVRLGADLDELDDRLHTPLICLCNVENDRISSKMVVNLLRLLIRGGADTTVVDEEGLSLLHLVSKNNRADLMKELLELVPDLALNTTDLFGNTPLHYAAAHESTKITNLLLPKLTRYRVNMDERNKLGFTPLLIAASNGRLGVARRLYETERVSTDITDSLYFKTTYDWLTIYFEWKSEENILSHRTKFISKCTDHIQIEKHHLVPVETKPPANSLLERFSRQQTALNNRVNRNRTYTAVRTTIIPQLVLTRPYTAPESVQKFHQQTRTVRPIVALHDSYTAGASNKSLMSVDNSPRVMGSYQSTSQHDPLVPLSYIHRPHTRLRRPGAWNDTIDIVNLSSDQLSQSYRPSATPIQQEGVLDENTRPTILINADGSKAKDMLLGVLGKVRRQVAGTMNATTSTKEEMSTSAAALEEGSNRTGALKAKMLKYAATKRALTNQEA